MTSEKKTLSKGGMSFVQHTVLNKFYADAAGNPERLPWHRTELTGLLVRVAKNREAGRALDIGCGSGIFSSYLASLGYQTTAIDLHGDAIAMARALSDSGPSFDVCHVDALTYQPGVQFDLVYDSGCMHNLSGAMLTKYRERILEWLAPDGSFVLEHWDKRHRLDWRPIGPIRRSAESIKNMFLPLRCIETDSLDFEVPFPIGPRVRGTCYHFRH